jgi:hypothetical protein
LKRLLESRGILETPDINAAVDKDLTTINEYTDKFTQKAFGAESVVVTTYEGLGDDDEEGSGHADNDDGVEKRGDDDDDDDDSDGSDDTDQLDDEDDEGEVDGEVDGDGDGDGEGGAGTSASAADKADKHKKRRRSNSNRHGRYTESGKKKLRAQYEKGPKRVKHTDKGKSKRSKRR